MKNLSLSFAFLLSCSLVWAQPANDLCSNAQSVTPNGTCVNGRTSGGGGASDNVSGAVGCESGNVNRHYDVWYSFVATGTSLSLSVTPGTATDVEILLADGCGGTLLASDCATGSNSANLNLTGLTIGVTYFYAVATFDNRGTFQSCPLSFTPTANDECSGSVVSPTD